ncbi:MAG TPA: pyridoxine 5'-phosphate synthase [Elusimicrobiota bacterium]|nr:pyridoxine 5'-phosphate synthase [Elusimicrobiota bacterium]
MKISSRVKLGVNIDHVATLRQARQEADPDLLAAAQVCRQAGASAVIVHLRRDRRHVQDEDLRKLCAAKGAVYLEISSEPAMVAAALRAGPESVCLVPERPGEVTTEGGLNLAKSGRAVAAAAKRLKAKGLGVSLFIDPEAAGVRAAKGLGADTVEFCTTAYCAARGQKAAAQELERLELASYLAYEMGLAVHAGHGLGYHNVKPVADIPHLDCLNIGFSIVARSVFVGLKAAVSEMKELVS